MSDASPSSDTAVPERAAPDLTGQLVHAAHVLNSRLAAALAEVGLTAREHCVLEHAYGHERTQIQLAELGDIDKTTMVVTMDSLESSGLAERRPSPVDRRARIVAVTQAGAARLTESRAIVDRVHQEVLDALPATQSRAFTAALSALNADQLAHPTPAAPTTRRAPRSRR